MDFIPTAILRHTIRPLEMSGKNKIRGAQSQDVRSEPMASEGNGRSLPPLMRRQFSLSDVLTLPGLAAISRLQEGAAVPHDP